MPLLLAGVIAGPGRSHAQMALTWRSETPSAEVPTLSEAKRLNENCPEGGSPLSRKNVEAVQAAAKLDLNALEKIESLVDGCLPEEASPEAARESLVKNLRAKMAKAPRIKKEGGGVASTEDLVNIGLIARTLVGEIATKRKCQKSGENPFAKAIGKIVLNRVDLAKKGQPDGGVRPSEFVDSTFKQGGDALRSILFRPYQFSVWNKGDPAQKWAMCPARVPGLKYLDKNGKVIATASIGEYIAWSAAVEVAAKLVLGEKSFRGETRNVKGYFYAEGGAAHDKLQSRGFRKVHGVTVGGHLIDDVDCLELWDPPAALKASQKKK